jgi:hypothetical protein
VARHADLVGATSAALTLQTDRWRGQLEQLRSLLPEGAA